MPPFCAFAYFYHSQKVNRRFSTFAQSFCSHTKCGNEGTEESVWWANLANSHLLPVLQLCFEHGDIFLLNMTAHIPIIPFQRCKRSGAVWAGRNLTGGPEKGIGRGNVSVREWLSRHRYMFYLLCRQLRWPNPMADVAWQVWKHLIQKRCDTGVSSIPEMPSEKESQSCAQQDGITGCGPPPH